MWNLIVQKLRNKKWMVACLLLGNLLMIAVAAANPMYSQAVLQRALKRDLSNYLVENNRYPGTVVARQTFFEKKNTMAEIQMGKRQFDEAAAAFEVPALLEVSVYSQGGVWAESVLQVEGEVNETTLTLTSYSDVEDHIRITHGQMYSRQLEGNTIDVIVNEKTFVERNLMLGGELELRKLTDEKGVPYRLRIVGMFESTDEQSPYWLTDPSRWNGQFLMDQGLFLETFVETEHPAQMTSASWYTVLDHNQMRADQVERMLQVVEDYRAIFHGTTGQAQNVYFYQTLEEFVPKAQKLNTTITVLQVPVLVLLAAFIFMVFRQMLEIEQNEISVFKSRGAARGQIVRLYFGQSLLIAGIGLIGGIQLAVLICKTIGVSNAFLEFVQRSALPVEIGPRVWLFAFGAAVLCVCAMVIPVLWSARITIVDHKRRKNRTSKQPWWQRVFLDGILLGVSFYGLYQFRSQEEWLAQKVLDGAGLDPLLYLCSSLFMLGAGLLILRLLPLVTRVVFWLGKKWWPPAIYASFLRILRTGGNQGFLVVFLVLTVSMGIFSTRTARTINANGEEKIRYGIGADLVLQERWVSNAEDIEAAGSSGANMEITYQEPDFGKYLQMDGVEQATRVLVDDYASVSVKGGTLRNVRLMGIHTKEFGQTAWFRESLLAVHWYEYLNAISQNADAILVSSNFSRIYGYQVGDVLNYTNQSGDSARGVIYGFVDYWPSYAPVTPEKGADGLYQDRDNFLIVAHLAHLQSIWGITPYQVWLRTRDSSRFLYEYARETGTVFTTFEDADAQLVELKNDPIFQGTNGILTIGFIIVLLLCAAGFLIHWILSIQSRTLQFGIFRAMGMSAGAVLSMLGNEQIFISGAAIGGGVLVGQLSSALFVPLIQIAYSSADKVIPLEIIRAAGDDLRLGIVIGLMIAVCMVVLGVLISKIKITQALKLGED